MLGPYFAVRFTHQGVMADNDIILLQRHDGDRCWESESSGKKFNRIDIRIMD